MTRRDKADAGMTPDDLCKRICVEEVLAVHMQNAGPEGRVMQEQERRPLRRRRQRDVEPFQRCRTELALRLAGNTGIQEHQINTGDSNSLVERTR